MTTPANSNKTAAPPEVEHKAPESDTTLATLAMPIGEVVLTLRATGTPIYGILNRSRAMTGQSDYYRLQFRGFARTEAGKWEYYDNEDAQFHPSHNCAWAKVDHPSKSISFGPRPGVTCSESFAGLGLETFLFAQVIIWAKGIYPSYSVAPGLVTIPSTATQEERMSRNAFYASQGLQFDWQDEQQRSGLYFKDRASRLLGVWDKEHIEEVGGESMLKTLAGQDASRSELEEKVHRLESAHLTLKSSLQKEKNTSQILMGILILGIMLALWALL